MGQLRSGPLLVGQIGSGFQVSASLQKFCFKNVATFWGGVTSGDFFLGGGNLRGMSTGGISLNRFLLAKNQ